MTYTLDNLIDNCEPRTASERMIDYMTLMEA